MFACMDTETTEWNNHNLHLELKFGYICYFSNNKRKNVLFENAKDMFSSIEYMRHTFKKPFLVFTHNMDYDFKFILNYMRERYSFKIIDNGLIFSIKVYRKTDSDNPKKKKYLVCEFRNSLRLIPLSLKKIGIALRLHKIERNQNVQDNLDMFHTYCIRDCNIIYKALKYLQKFFQKQDYPIEIEKISMSFPSIAYKIFHKNNSEFETIDEKCRHTNQLTNICNWINDYFRKYYYGGRCEVFDLMIHEMVAYLDVNSLYPSIMINYRFPKPKYWRVKSYEYTEHTFAVLCDIDETYENIPLVAQKVNEKLLFLSNKKESLITIEEYLYIVENRPNTKITIKERWECDEWIYPFRYMKPLYDERVEMKKYAQKNDTIVNPLELFIKLLLNSTYGKFAERSTKMNVEFFKCSEITSEFAKKKLIECKDVKFIDDTMICYNEYEVTYIPNNLCFGHRITSLARLTLVKMMDSFIKKGVEPIYCDTDSIFIDYSNINKVSEYLDDFELGKMKIEEKFTKFNAFAPKEYAFFEKDKRKQKVKGLHEGTIFDYYENECSYVKPTKYRECLVRKLDFQSAIKVIKKKKSFYDKRIVNEDLTTKPISNIDDMSENFNKSIIFEQLKYYKQFIK